MKRTSICLASFMIFAGCMAIIETRASDQTKIDNGETFSDYDLGSVKKYENHFTINHRMKIKDREEYIEFNNKIDCIKGEYSQERFTSYDSKGNARLSGTGRQPGEESVKIRISPKSPEHMLYLRYCDNAAFRDRIVEINKIAH